MLGELIHTGVGWEQRTVDALEPKGSMISAAVSAAHERKTGLAFIHTHPFASHPLRLSAIDTRTTQRLGAAFAELLDGPFASLVIGPSGWAGVVYQRNGLVPLERISLVGRRLEIHGHDPDHDREPIDDRQRRALGQSGNALLRGLRVGIVGVGGLGAPLAETLARMGVGSLTLIDDDVLELSNVRRVFGVTRDDAEQRRPKVKRSRLDSSAWGSAPPCERSTAMYESLLSRRNCSTAMCCFRNRHPLEPRCDDGTRGARVLPADRSRRETRDATRRRTRLAAIRAPDPVAEGAVPVVRPAADAHRIRIEFMSSFERQA